MTFKNELERLQAILKEREKDLTREMQHLPEGSLYVRIDGDKYFYYQRFPVGGNRKKERRYGITGDSEKIFALARKNYVEKALRIIRKDIEVFESLVGEYVSCDEASVMKGFIERYPQLAEGVFCRHKEMDEWAKEHKPDESFFESDLRSVSLKGVKMRSAGEIYITSRLEHFGIPHRYEAKTGIPDLGYWPDFTIMRPRDRKIVFWEHFGKVNDMDYVRDNIEKVTNYIEYGITPWDNLILTYNNRDGGFNAKIIDAMIEGWLL